MAALLLAAGVLLWLFVRHEHRAAFPLVDLKLFAEPLYRSVLIVYFVVMSCFFGTLMVITQHFQNVRDLSPLRRFDDVAGPRGIRGGESAGG